MAHESFEDEATAAVMNRLFVNVKVDREERPDLDKVYQLAHQVLTQRGGGWPLTMFLAPDDLTPFFGGTYFPKEARYGMPAFADLLTRVAAFYRDERDERRGARTPRCAACSTRLLPPARRRRTAITREPVEPRAQRLAASFDPRFGGFGHAPKFPHPACSSSSCALAATPTRTGPSALMALLTLRRMAEGGIFDQLGGGFCRYSVDPFWMIPHFEKMLYDNGAAARPARPGVGRDGRRCLARSGARHGRLGARARCARPGGGFYAALDADSEGHEGKFYVWQREEVAALLTPDEYRVLRAPLRP